MSDSSTISSFSLVTLKIFLDVFLQSDEIFKDWTFCDKTDKDGKRKMLLSGLTLCTATFGMLGTMAIHTTVNADSHYAETLVSRC